MGSEVSLDLAQPPPPRIKLFSTNKLPSHNMFPINNYLDAKMPAS